jgi:hypothetical protein
MSECQHQWEMSNIHYGFVAFEKCYHCNTLKTFFSVEDFPVLGDEYREGDHFWNRVENAQSFQFDLRCSRCDKLVKMSEMMGLFQCTSCMPDCPVEILQKEYESERTWLMVAFGFLPEAVSAPIPLDKLDILSEYFNQRRDTSRSRIKIVPFNFIKDLARCKGVFLHDIGMLSREAPLEERKQLF